MRPRQPPRSVATCVIVAAVMAVALSGCSAGIEVPTGPVLVSHVVAGDGTVQELRNRQHRWQQLGLRDYTVVIGTSCFCTAEWVRPAQLEVRNGVVVRVTAVDDGAELPVESRPSIDDLFAQAITAAEAGTVVEVRYDAAYHYPASLVIGTLANDAGVAYAVSGLVKR